MSDDLVALVSRLQCGVATYDDMADAAELMEAQEAEITRLRARVAELEGALRGIIVDCEVQCPHWAIKDDARAALTGGKE